MNFENEIEVLSKRSFQGTFPYEECRDIAAFLGRSSGDLTQELDWYFDNIVGYGSSASRLQNRSSEELRYALKLLCKDFFEYFPDEEIYRNVIDPIRTPRLYEQMRASEIMRTEMIELIRVILDSRGDESAELEAK